MHTGTEAKLKSPPKAKMRPSILIQLFNLKYATNMQTYKIQTEKYLIFFEIYVNYMHISL